MKHVASCRQQGLPRTAGGWHGLEHQAHNVGAVSAACLVMRRERFEPFEENWQSDLGSVAWSVRLREKSGWLAFTPFSTAIGTANAPVLRDGQSWPEEEKRFPVLTDPCYSPHFSHMKANFHLNTDDKGRNVF